MSCGKIDVEISRLAVHQSDLAGIKVGDQVTLSQASDKIFCSDAAGNVLGFAAFAPGAADLNGICATVRSVRRCPQGEVVQLLVRTTGKRVNVVAQAGEPSPVRDAGKVYSLEKSSLQRLAASRELQELLRTARLQEDILTVDRASDREEALCEALQRPEFQGFCDKVSLSCGPTMFGNIIDALQGPAATAVDSDSDTGSPRPSNTENENATDIGQAAPVLTSIWGMASKIADTVRKGTAEIAASVTETDWKAELEAFGKEVAEDAQEASAYTVERLEALPDSVRHVPDKLTHLPPVDPQHVQQSLQQVGNRLRGLGASLFTNTATLLEQVQDAIAQEIESIDGHINRASRSSNRAASRQTLTPAKYSRLDADISAMQRNSSTYCDEPEDAVDYNSWLATFDLSSKKHDIQQLTSSNAFMSELQSRIVPLIVQYEVFWTRYFYQLHKLQQKHEQLQALAQRAAKASEEEEVGWDDDEAAPTPRANAKPAESIALSASGVEDGTEGLEEAVATDVKLEEVEPVTAKEPTVKPIALTSKDSIGDDPSCSPSPVKGREDEAETSTASDDSGNGNGRWTVVKTPKQSSEQHRDDSGPSKPLGVGGATDIVASGPQDPGKVAKPVGPTGLEVDAQAPTEGPTALAQKSKAQSSSKLDKPGVQSNNGDSDIDSADLELSDDGGPMPDTAGARSDVDEDWGSWE